LKPNCLNAKTTPFGPLDFELDLTLELCHLTLFRIQISALANEIATHLSGARNDKREVAQNDKMRRADNNRRSKA
jgi:hypothetical protein